MSRDGGKCLPRVTVMNRVGSRRILNEQELLVSLQQRGDVIASVVHLQELEWEAQMRVMRETDVFVYVHGAAMANAALLPPHAAIVTLYQWCQRWNWELLNAYVASAHGLRYYHWQNMHENCTRFHTNVFV